MRPALFWDLTRRTVVIPYRRLGTTYRVPIQGSEGLGFIEFFTLVDGPYKLSRNVGTELPLRKVPEESRSHYSIHLSDIGNKSFLYK